MFLGSLQFISKFLRKLLLQVTFLNVTEISVTEIKEINVNVIQQTLIKYYRKCKKNNTCINFHKYIVLN